MRSNKTWIIRPVFKYHVGLVVAAWAILLPLHIHLSGYGFTNYLQGSDILRPLLGWLPGANAYNTIENCGLPVCGYPLTNIFHGIAGGLVMLTVSLLFVSFSMGWYLFLSTIIAVIFPLAWEVWEIITHVTRCLPAAFATVAQACNECVRMLTDQIFDVAYALVAITIVAVILYVVDRRHPEIEV